MCYKIAENVIQYRKKVGTIYEHILGRGLSALRETGELEHDLQ